MKKVKLGNKIKIYQWLIGYPLGTIMQYHVPCRRYRNIADLLSYEIVSSGTDITRLDKSACTIREKDYLEGLSSICKMQENGNVAGLKSFTSNPEYSRQIHHSGGLDGHLFNR